MARSMRTGALHPARWFDQLRERLRNAVETPARRDRMLADGLRTVAAQLRSGRSLQASLHLAGTRVGGSVGGALRSAAGRLALGVPLDAAMRQLANELGGESAQLLAIVFAVYHRRGGDAGHVCQRTAHLLHERNRLRDEARSETAQARFTARAVMGLPVLVLVGWAVVAPASLVSMLTPGMLVLMLPSATLLLLGTYAIRRCATAVTFASEQASPADTRRSLVARAAGNGTVRGQTLRLGAIACAVCALMAASAPGNMFVLTSGLSCVGFAVAWPVLHARRTRADLERVAESALPGLCEVSLALLAAGATPSETIEAAIDASPVLAPHVAPALAQLRLGRSPASALGACEVFELSAELDAWLQLLSMGGSTGVSVSDGIDTLLRDARSRERERYRRLAATTGPRMQLVTVFFIVPAIMWLMLLAITRGMLQQLQATGMLAG